jgi:hypothetical protein
MRVFLLGVISLVCAGCTTMALQQNTLNLVASLTDTRFQEVLDNLAKIAANEGNLPSYAPIIEGSTMVNDTLNFDPKTAWARATFKGFSAETFSMVGTHSPQPTWTVDPVAQYQQMEALQSAILWVLCGPPHPGSHAEQLLELFKVEDDLRRLPAGWLHVGCLQDVPSFALYSAHCHGKWVWVTKEGMVGLSAFTLILQDIATVDLSSLQLPDAALIVKVKLATKNKAGQADSTSKSDDPTIETKNAKKVHWVQSANTLKIAAKMPGGLGIEQDAQFRLPEELAAALVPSVFYDERNETLFVVPSPTPVPGLNVTPSFIGRSSKGG